MGLWVEVTGGNERTQPIGSPDPSLCLPAQAHTLTSRNVVTQARKGTCWSHPVTAPSQTLIPLLLPHWYTQGYPAGNLGTGVGESVHVRLQSLPPLCSRSQLYGLQDGTKERKKSGFREVWSGAYPLLKLEGLLTHPSLPSSPGTGGAKRVFDQNMLLATTWQRRVALATSITIIFMLSRKNEEGGSGDISILKSPRKWV